MSCAHKLCASDVCISRSRSTRSEENGGTNTTFLSFKVLIICFSLFHHILPFFAKQLFGISLYLQVCRVNFAWVLMFWVCAASWHYVYLCQYHKWLMVSSISASALRTLFFPERPRICMFLCLLGTWSCYVQSRKLKIIFLSETETKGKILHT